MKINHYEFGKIVIDGKEYSSDVIISKNAVIDNWWRKEGHKLRIEDVSKILDNNPEFLIVGTGYYGHMEVLPETREFIKSKGIDLKIEKTRK